MGFILYWSATPGLPWGIDTQSHYENETFLLEGTAAEVVSTTGAGDSFMGALLYQATRAGFSINDLDAEELKKTAEFANACSAGSTRKYGSMAAMTYMEDAGWIMKNVPKKEPAYDL